MASSTIGQTLGALRAGREQADALLDRAAAEAARIESEGAERARERATARLAEIESLRAVIAEHAEEVGLAASRMAESMTAAAGRLIELAGEQDFSPPPWPRADPRNPEPMP